MKKSEAVEIFGSKPKTAAALGISLQAVHEWPDILPPRISDRVLGAATRMRREIPAYLVYIQSGEK